MKDALTHSDEALSSIVPGGCMLLLDFDGTLAPIVADPAAARPSQETLDIVRDCLDRFPVAIISGRALSDIRGRIALPGLWYAGSHGLEWYVGDETSVKETPAQQLAAMRGARAELSALAAEEPRTIYEDKVHCATLHYRALTEDEARLLSARAHAALAPHLSAGLRVMDGMRTFEVMPAIDWDKGACALMLVRMAEDTAGRKLIPVYIGDAITDEDAFRALPKGVTIKVGRDESSAARFFVENREDTDVFLKRLCQKATRS